MIPIRKNVVFVCVSVGLVFLASKYRNNVLESVQQIYHGVTKKGKKRKEEKKIEDHVQNKEFKVSLDKVILADSPEKCDYAVQRIRCNLSDGVLGFDCEWVNEGPVSLVQLATQNGVCALFRLNRIGHVPSKLKELLSNPQLLKVGVGSFEDGKKIARDYDCKVVGTIDLRTLSTRYGFSSPKSLAGFCMQYLGVQMDKAQDVRCGDWNAECLTDEQIVYASYDAYASVLIYYEILQRAKQKHTLWEKLIFQLKGLLNNKEAKLYLPNGIIDARFKVLKDKIIYDNNSVHSNNKLGQIISRNNFSGYKNSIPARNKPLYHNCYLQAPDGDTLCTCDKKKAEWYVSKQLGEVVSEEPFTVKLKFEPSGRALGEVGKYYTLVKVNQCVVCGTSDKFIRKNVVPREYRKYFPLVMKSHQSHDVLLLCPACHEISNYHDLQLRRKLAETCDAPLSGPPTHVRDEAPRGWRMLQSAVKVLRDETQIPHKRRKELESYVTKYTGHKEITPTFLNKLHEQLLLKSPQKCNFLKEQKKNVGSQTKSEPHGLKVVQYFEKKDGGLVMLEKLWREHFLDTMKPKFLPHLWSVSHNQERLSLRKIQNRIEPLDAKLAGLQN